MAIFNSYAKFPESIDLDSIDAIDEDREDFASVVGKETMSDCMGMLVVSRCMSWINTGE